VASVRVPPSIKIDQCDDRAANSIAASVIRTATPNAINRRFIMRPSGPAVMVPYPTVFLMKGLYSILVFNLDVGGK
jgi:hypothetical protein